MPRATLIAAKSGVGDGPAAADRLAGALAAFRAAGDEGRAMIARLAALLDHLDALPLDAGAAFGAGAGRYLALRYGPLPSPPPPSWPWAASLRGAHIAAHGPAVACRAAYRALAPDAQRRATAAWGEFVGPGGSDAPLWRRCWPQEAEEALDARAAALGVDTRALAALAARRRYGRGGGA